MPRCSQKTTNGTRCKGNGMENDGLLIMCATHLRIMGPLPSVAPAPVVSTPVSPPCTHKSTCDLTHEKCCECSDTRPIQKDGYVAYLNTYLADAELVSRHYYYCPSCKDRLTHREFSSIIAEMKDIVGIDDTARWYIDGLAKTHNAMIKDVKNRLVDAINTHVEWNFCVLDTLDHILSGRLAGMPEDRATWTGDDAKLNTLMNKVITIHKSMLTQPQKPVNPDRPETLEAAYGRIDELQKKISELEPKLAVAKSAAKQAAGACLWNSGCEDLCYHFGHCSDVMGDCWEPVYHESGLDGLKAHLRIMSNDNHNNKSCEDCTRWIESLHD